MLESLLFKKSKKINESCSLSKAAKMSSTYRDDILTAFDNEQD